MTNLEKNIKYKGGCCQICGFKRSLRALQFHHIDPSQKDPNINLRTASIDSERCKNELEKCILLCANCHLEVHQYYPKKKQPHQWYYSMLAKSKKPWSELKRATDPLYP